MECTVPNVVRLPRRLALPAAQQEPADEISLLGDDMRRLVVENLKLLMAQRVRQFDNIAARYFALVSSLARTPAQDDLLANIVIARSVIDATLIKLRELR